MILPGFVRQGGRNDSLPAALSDLDLLANSGVLALNRADSPPRAMTVVVLGVARGGTTMVASVLQALGVPMGEKLGPVLEDTELSQAIETRDVARLTDLVASRNAAHQKWGWKRPSAIEYHDVWRDSFRNPYIIAIFRDPFAIANRNRISMLSDVFESMEQAVNRLGTLVRFLREQKGPLLLCSYEKVLLSPEIFVDAVSDFLDLNASESRDDAVRRVSPSPGNYLETSRITHSSGRLDEVNECVCSGWAFYPRQPARVARVQLFVNDTPVQTVTAELPRPDIKERGEHPTGLCGFRFEWPPGRGPRSGDRVEARVEGDIKALRCASRPLRTRGVKPLQRGGKAAKNETFGRVGVRGALPSFYGIGAQGAATAWLHGMLKRHPQVHLPKRKEVHYWDLHRDRQLQWYREHFVPGQINGDVTPAYAMLPEATIAEIHALTPTARVLFSMSHPLDRAWSFVLMAARKEDSVRPHDLVTGEAKGAVLGFVRKTLSQPLCLARCDYASMIRRWRQQFGDEAVLWFRQEQVELDPRGLLGAICRHIGVDPAWAGGLSPEIIGRPLDAAATPAFPPALRAEYAETFARHLDDLEQLLGEKFTDWRS